MGREGKIEVTRSDGASDVVTAWRSGSCREMVVVGGCLGEEHRGEGGG